MWNALTKECSLQERRLYKGVACQDWDAKAVNRTSFYDIAGRFRMSR